MIENLILCIIYKIKIMFKHQKMALGVGEKRLNLLQIGYNQFKEIFPISRALGQRNFKRKEPLLFMQTKEEQR